MTSIDNDNSSLKNKFAYQEHDLVNEEIIKENLKYEKLNSDDHSCNSDKLINDDQDPEDFPNRDNKSCFQRWFSKISGGSLRGSIFAVASVTFGGGCLAFPIAIAKSGPLIGFSIFFFSAWISYLTASYLIEVGISEKTMDYNALVVKSAGNKMRIFADINNIILCMGVIMSYQYMVYGFLQIILKDLFDLEIDTTGRVIMVLICTIFIQIPLSLIKNISVLQYASILATISLVYAILVIIIETPFYFSQNYGTSDKYKFSVFPPDGIGFNFLNTLSTFLFGFCSHNGLFQVFMEMDRPNLRRSMKVIQRATILEIVLYFCISICGFLSTFYETPDVFIKRPDLKGFTDYFMIVGKISLIIILNCCMSINYNIMRLSIKSMVFDDKTVSFIKDLIITVLVYIITNVITFFVKDASTILGLVGGISTVVISFICPILIKLKLCKNMTNTQLYLNYALFVFIMIAGIACTVKSVYDYAVSL